MIKSKMVKLLSCCIACSMFYNVGYGTAFAELENVEDISEADIVDELALLSEEETIEIPVETRYIVKYCDANGEKVDYSDKKYINPYCDLIIIPEDAESIIEQLKNQNNNVQYIQQDYKLLLFDNNSEEILDEAVDAYVASEVVNTDEQKIVEDIPINIDEVPVIAVIDSGVDINHEALTECIWVNNNESADGTDSDGNGYIDDISGWDFINDKPIEYDESQIVDYNHGTHVAGIIAGSNSEINGVNSEAKIMPLKSFKDGSAYTSDIIRAIDYAENMGADIVNCSFGSNEENPVLKETIENTDMLFVCAAGNKAKNIDESPVYPASYDMDRIISVAATDAQNHIAYFSNYGDSVDVAAPGVSIYSALAENEYGNLSGTSMAAAYISGIVANMARSNHNSSVADIKTALQENAESEAVLNDSEYTIKSFSYSVSAAEVNSLPEMESLENDNAKQITQIGAGGYHSVILVNNKAFTFGDNSHNQCSGMYYFGEGNFAAPGNELFIKMYDSYSTAKTRVIKKISTKGDHTLYLMADGTVRAMGANAYGQLGIGYVGGENITDAYEPTEQVTGLSNIVDIAAGHQFSLALDSNGRIYAWGNNKDGQLGIGNTYGFFYAPQRISGITNVASISAGYYHALATTENQNIYGWGRAYNGALGDLSGEKYYSPQLLNIENVDKVIAGLDNSFFIKSDKTVYAYGYNAYGQLGDGTAEARNTLIQIPIDNVSDISTGFSTVFLKADGTAYGCGLNSCGQLGVGNFSNTIKSITQIPGVYEAVSVGGLHTLFLKNDEVYSAGWNGKKQSGFENGVGYSVPTLIPSYAKESFTVDDVSFDYGKNKLIISGTFEFGNEFGREYGDVYVGYDYRNPFPSVYPTGVSFTLVNKSYSVECDLNELKDGTNYGWIKVDGYPCRRYFSFDYDASQNTITGTSTVSVTAGMPYIFSVNAANITNIKNKVFTVSYDKSMLLLNDVCAQTWKKDNMVGTIADTDIEVLSLSDSEIKFRTSKEQTTVSGIINMIKFDSLKDGDTKITVTVE